MQQRILFFLTLIFLTGAQSIAQDAILKGRVISAQSQAPLEYAVVQISDSGDSIYSQVITDQKGRYECSGISFGKYIIAVQYLGFETWQKDVEVTSGRIKLDDILLMPKEYLLQEATVSGEASPIEYRVDKQVINVSKQLDSQGGTAADALKHSPSVQVDAEGNVALRGSNDYILLVDGRPSIMDKATVLNTMQAESIEKIEVITNPSALFSAEGNTGIINIITLPKRKASTSGLISAMIANGDKYSASAKFQSGNSKTTWFGGASVSSKLKINNDEILRTNIQLPEFSENFSSVRDVLREDMNLSTGMESRISEKHNLRLDISAGKWNYGREIASTFSSSLLQDIITASEDFDNENTFIKPGINYYWKISDEKEITIDGQWSIIRNDITNIYLEQEQSAGKRRLNFAEKSKPVLRMDYKYNLWGTGTMESGVQYSGDYSDNELDYSILNIEGGSWILDENQSNIYSYSASNFAFYSVYNTKIKDIDIQAGVREEYNIRDLIYEEDDNASLKLQIFPSVHLSKNIKNNQNIGLSYGRRVNRPTEWQLYPVVWAGDRFNFIKGNAALKDEFVNAFEFNYGLFSEKLRFSSQLFHMIIKDKISSYIQYDGHDFIDTWENLSHSTNSGMEMMINYMPAAYIDFTLSASGYYETWSGITRDHSVMEGNTFSAMGNFRTTLKYKKNTQLQFMAIYYAPRNTIQGYMKSFYYFDFILKQYLLKRNLSVTLRTHNTFDTGIMHYTINNGAYKTVGKYIYEGPTFILSLTYKFNNFKSSKVRDGFRSDFNTGMDH